jgi:ElaB/YqjD/DUF883 family membrane-anchored ribosome-binding protein
MTNKSTTFPERSIYPERSSDGPSSLGDKISDTATQVKQKASDLGQMAADKIDNNRDAAATGLDKAASTLHDKAESLPGGEKVTSLAHATADKLSTTADYVRTHDVNRMMGDVETLVKNNPGPALLVAAAVGFLVARAFSSSSNE